MIELKKEDFLKQNRILNDNEIAIETDTKLYKIGDGVTAYIGLPYGNTNSGTLENLTDKPKFLKTVQRLMLKYNPVIADKFLVFENDTKQYKIGDGVTKYSELPYQNEENGGGGGGGTNNFSTSQTLLTNDGDSNSIPVSTLTPTPTVDKPVQVGSKILDVAGTEAYVTGDPSADPITAITKANAGGGKDFDDYIGRFENSIIIKNDHTDLKVLTVSNSTGEIQVISDGHYEPSLNFTIFDISNVTLNEDDFIILSSQVPVSTGDMVDISKSVKEVDKQGDGKFLKLRNAITQILDTNIALDRGNQLLSTRADGTEGALVGHGIYVTADPSEFTGSKTVFGVPFTKEEIEDNPSVVDYVNQAKVIVTLDDAYLYWSNDNTLWNEFTPIDTEEQDEFGSETDHWNGNSKDRPTFDVAGLGHKFNVAELADLIVISNLINHGTILEIQGKGFGDTQGSGKITDTSGDLPNEDIREWNDTRIIIDYSIVDDTEISVKNNENKWSNVYTYFESGGSGGSGIGVFSTDGELAGLHEEIQVFYDEIYENTDFIKEGDLMLQENLSNIGRIKQLVPHMPPVSEPLSAIAVPTNDVFALDFSAVDPTQAFDISGNAVTFSAQAGGIRSSCPRYIQTTTDDPSASTNRLIVSAFRTANNTSYPINLINGSTWADDFSVPWTSQGYTDQIVTWNSTTKILTFEVKFNLASQIASTSTTLGGIKVIYGDETLPHVIVETIHQEDPSPVMKRYTGPQYVTIDTPDVQQWFDENLNNRFMDGQSVSILISAVPNSNIQIHNIIDANIIISPTVSNTSGNIDLNNIVGTVKMSSSAGIRNCQILTVSAVTDVVLDWGTYYAITVDNNSSVECVMSSSEAIATQIAVRNGTLIIGLQGGLTQNFSIGSIYNWDKIKISSSYGGTITSYNSEGGIVWDNRTGNTLDTFERKTP